MFKNSILARWALVLTGWMLLVAICTAHDEVATSVATLQRFALDSRTTYISVSVDLNFDAEIYFNGVPINDPSYTQKYVDNVICSSDHCYSIPVISSLLSGTANLTCTDSDSGNVTSYRLLLLPSINSTGIHNRGIVDLVLRQPVGFESVAADSLVAVILAPLEDQNVAEIQEEIVYLRTNGKPGSVMTQWRKHAVKISTCEIDLQIDALTDSEGTPVSGYWNITGLNKLDCSVADLNSVVSEVEGEISGLNSNNWKSAESNLLSLFSSPTWSNCDWFLKQTVHRKDYIQPTRDVSNCYAEPGTASWRGNPCCNLALQSFLCCNPRNRNITYSEWNGTNYFSENNIITSSECPGYTLQGLKSLSEFDFEQTSSVNPAGHFLVSDKIDSIQALEGKVYTMAIQRQEDRENGCLSIPWFSSQVQQGILQMFDKCAVEIYGTVGLDYGVGQRCYKDSDCWGLNCNRIKNRCEIPYENPGLAWANCIYHHKNAWIQPIFNLKMGLKIDATLKELQKAFQDPVYRFPGATCLGPSSIPLQNSTEDQCLKDKYCNWAPCSNDIFHHSNCSEMCVDPILPPNFCGICPDEYGPCDDYSEPEGCLIDAIDDPVNCDQQDGKWSPLERRCYLPNVTRREECVFEKVCLPLDSSFFDDTQNSLNNIIASKRTTVDSSEPTTRSNTPIEKFRNFDPNLNPNWNRTICPTVCYTESLDKPACHDTECDHPCCDPSHTCTDPAVRACTCAIDAFCCDEWDPICNSRAIQDGCVACNCVRRKWNPELNHRNGLCTVLMPSQEYCEDEWRGNGTWWPGRTWQAGRFASSDRCDQGACDHDITINVDQCATNYSCKGQSCHKCVTERPPDDPQYTQASQLCTTLGTSQCFQCDAGLSSCSINQTLGLCAPVPIQCPTEELCNKMGSCSDKDLLGHIGGCFYPTTLNPLGFPVCFNKTGSNPHDRLTILGCHNPNITDPSRCHGSGAKWKWPAKDEQSCKAHGVVCKQLRSEVFGIQTIVETLRANCSACITCGGSCEPLFEWNNNTWSAGKPITLSWVPRAFNPFNKWATTMDISKIKSIVNNAMDSRRKEALITDFGCRNQVQTVSLKKFAEICSKSKAPPYIPPVTPPGSVNPPVPITPTPTEVPTPIDVPTPVNQTKEEDFDEDFKDEHEKEENEETFEDLDNSEQATEAVPTHVLNTNSEATVPYHLNPTLVAQRTLYYGLADSLKAAPFMLEFDNQTVSYSQNAITVTVETISLYAYMEYATKTGRAHGIVDVVREHGFLSGLLIGGGVRVNFTSDKGPIGLSFPAHLCMDITHPTFGHWSGLFPVVDLATPEWKIVSKQKPTVIHFDAYHSKDFSVVDDKPYTIRVCLQITSSTGLVFLISRTEMFPPYMALLALTVVFFLFASGALVQSVLLWKNDPSQQRVWKVLTHFLFAVGCIVKGTHFVIILDQHWQRFYPEDLVSWYAFEWPVNMIFSTAITMYLFARDDEPRLKNFKERMPAWIGVLALVGTIGSVSVGQIASYFPVHEWSDKLIADIDRIESLFTYILVIVTALGMIVSGIWSFVQKSTTASRIAIVIFVLVGFIHYGHVMVWYYLEDNFQNDSVWWINTLVLAGEQLLIALISILTLNESVGFSVASDEEIMEAERLSIMRKNNNNWKSARVIGTDPTLHQFDSDETDLEGDQMEVDEMDAPRETQHSLLIQRLDASISRSKDLKQNVSRVESTLKNAFGAGSYSRELELQNTQFESMSPASDVGAYMEANASFSDVEFAIREEDAEEDTDGEETRLIHK